MNWFYTDRELEEIGFKSLGEDVRISRRAIIRRPELVSLGDHIAIDPFVFISTQLDVRNYVHIAHYTGIIGGRKSYCKFSDYSFVAPRCTLVCGSEDYTGLGLINPTIPEKYRKLTYGKIIFEKYSGLGADTTALPNVTIGEGAVTGAKALVTKSLAPWWIYVGIPAKKHKERIRHIILKYIQEIEARRVRDKMIEDHKEAPKLLADKKDAVK